MRENIYDQPAAGGDETGPWREYRRLVVSELESLNRRMHELNEKLDGRLNALQVDVITLKAKAGLLGAVGGAVFGAMVSWVISKR